MFRKDHLRVHLASPANFKCKLVNEALHSSAAGTQHDVPLSELEEAYWNKTTELPVSSGGDRPSRKPCDICREAFEPSTETLIAHAIEHMHQLSAKSFKCDDGELGFAFKKDLDRHKKAASLGWCGFNLGLGHECTGHHPVAAKHRDRYYLTSKLWAWELCQLRSHRAMVARLIAEQLAYRQAAHESLDEQRLACMALTWRFSDASLHSCHSVPEYLKLMDPPDVDELAMNLERLMLDRSKPVSPPPFGMRDVTLPRPESAILSVSAGNQPRSANPF